MRRIKKNMTCIIGLFSMVVLFTPLSQVSATQTIEPLVVTTEPTILDLDETNSLLPRQTRITTNTFYGGVTGIPGFGTVWGEFYPTQREVAVQAKGKQVKTEYMDLPVERLKQRLHVHLLEILPDGGGDKEEKLG